MLSAYQKKRVEFLLGSEPDEVGVVRTRQFSITLHKRLCQFVTVAALFYQDSYLIIKLEPAPSSHLDGIREINLPPVIEREIFGCTL